MARKKPLHRDQKAIVNRIGIPPLPAEDVQFLLLVFNVPRVRILQMQVGDDLNGFEWVPPGEPIEIEADGHDRPYIAELSETMLALRILPKADDFEPSTELEILSTIEKVEPTTFAFLSSDTAYLVGSPGSACYDTAKLWLSEVPLEAATFGPLEYLNQLELELWQKESKKNSYRDFFFDMDRKTELKLAEQYLAPMDFDILEDSLPVVMKALTKRFNHRYEEFAADADLCTPCEKCKGAKLEVQHFSTVLIDLMKTHLDDGSGGIDFDKGEEAYEMFANGELRLQLPDSLAWTTQPSSAFYFYFGEFALLCVELEVDVAVWSQLANVLVRTQRIFADVYPSAADNPAFEDYSACSFKEWRMWTGSEKQKLKDDYANVDLCIAAASNAHEFMPGIVL